MKEANFNKKVFKSRIGELIDNKRDLGNIKAKEQAKEIGIDFGTLFKYKRGELIPRIDALYELAKYYNVSADFLLGLSDSKASNINDRKIADDLGLSDLSVRTLKEKVGILQGFENNSPSVNEIIDFLINNLRIIFFLCRYWHSGFNQNKEKELDEARKQISKRDYDIAIKDKKYIYSPEEKKRLDDEEANDFIAFAQLEKTIKKDKEEYLKWIEVESGKHKKN